MRSHRLSTIAVLLVVFSACSSSNSRSSSTATTSAATPTPTTVPPASVAAKPSAGCADAARVSRGEKRVDTTSAGTPRWYFRYVPASYDGRTPMPVVIDLHGYLEGAGIHTQMSRLGPYGDKHRFITITPQGSGTKVVYWSTALDGADMAYLGHLLDEIDRTLCVDDRRVFVTGLSNGAFMTSAVACVYASRVAAVAPVAGIRDIPGCAPARAVPVVTFHGTADGFVSYNGGLGERARALPAPDGSARTVPRSTTTLAPGTPPPTIPNITSAWAARNGCTAEPPSSRRIAGDVTLLAWKCPPGAEVQLYSVRGGGHAWPGSDFSKAIASAVGKTTFSISANDIMWKFFQAHPLPG